PKTSRHLCGNRSYLEYCITYNLQRGEIESTIHSISESESRFEQSFQFRISVFSSHRAVLWSAYNHWKVKFIITTLKQGFHRYL
ncbi:hypothetical protein Avbf_12838, partial [Armadillidium vulgare]